MIWKNKRPVYCDQSQQERGVMINRYVKCSKVELLIFEKMCAMWEEEIYYRMLFHHVSSLIYEAEKVLFIFIKKLEQAGFAVIRTVFDGSGKSVPEKIILSDRNSPFIAQSIIDEYYHQMNHNHKQAYITEAKLKVPDHVKEQHIVPISLSDLHKMQEGKLPSETKIYRLVLANVPIIFCFSSLNNFYTATGKKIRAYLRSTHLISDLQKKHIILNDTEVIYQALDELQYHKIHTVIDYILQHYSKIIGTYPPAERNLYQAIMIIHHMNKVQLESDAQLQIKNKRVVQDFKNIHNTIREAPEQTVSKREYHQMIKDYKQSWGDLFEENVITLCTNSPDNPLLITNQIVIHKEHLKNYFSNNFTAIQEKVYLMLINDMHKHIKIGDLPINIHYTNLSMLEEHLMNNLEQIDSVFYHILKYPQNHSSATANMNSRTILIFNIDLSAIFFHAYGKLSFFRRILYKLSSEYYDLHSHFSFLSNLIQNTREREYIKTSSQPQSHESDRQRAVYAFFPSQERTSA